MKKNLKKMAAFGLCAAMGTTMLAGCGGSDSGDGDNGIRLSSMWVIRWGFQRRRFIRRFR